MLSTNVNNEISPSLNIYCIPKTIWQDLSIFLKLMHLLFITMNNAIDKFDLAIGGK